MGTTKGKVMDDVERIIDGAAAHAIDANEPERNPKFRFGTVIATPGAVETFSSAFMSHCLVRHGQGDWGDLDADDKADNEATLKGARVGALMSAYTLKPDPGLDAEEKKLWVITEVDKSVTTLLLPEEY